MHANKNEKLYCNVVVVVCVWQPAIRGNLATATNKLSSGVRLITIDILKLPTNFYVFLGKPE